MTTTIVMNTTTGAVSEYDWAFQSITPLHAAGATGLHTLGGDTDAGAQIAAEVLSGKAGGEVKTSLGSVYVTLDGSGEGVLLVQGKSQTWTYPLFVRAAGVSRAMPGKGISESYLALGYRNRDGADFRLERIDAETFQSKSRRL